MKIAVFTGCQPRHITLVEHLASMAEQVYACVEVNTLFPGQIEDFFQATEVMRSYFDQMRAAEQAEFGVPRFLPINVRTLAIKSGDLNRIDVSAYQQALDADLIVVFGASYIRAPLVDHLVERRALNLHMGTSPYYRGSSCNFWALYDGRPDYVGATVHLLSRGLDSGSILCHALPSPNDGEHLDGFALGMRAVRKAFDVLMGLVKDDGWRSLDSVPQDRSLQIRYTRNRDFNDQVAAEYLSRAPSADVIQRALENRDLSRFLLPSQPKGTTR